MKTRVVFVILVLLVTGGALAFRLPRLDERPMHLDEAVHAEKLAPLLQEGHYRYDPNEYHGPTLNYFTLPVAWLRGEKTLAQTDELTLRVVPVVFGTLVVLLLLALGDGLGYPAALCAAVLTAVSPAMVFYSRYYIMEIILVFGTLALIAGAWRHIRGPSLGGCLLAGAGLGIMWATKETWVLAVAAMVDALLLNAAWARWVDRSQAGAGTLRRRVHDWRVAAGAGLALAIGVTLFTSFFTHARGPLDSLLTYVHDIRRAGGGGGGLHVNPWYFYFRTIGYTRYLGRGPIYSEALILALAVAGGVAGLTGRGLGKTHAGLVRFLTFYSLLLLGIYVAIPYKTPWCVLGPLDGLILLAGVGAAAVVRWVRLLPLRVVVGLVLAAATAQLGVQAWRASFKTYCDSRNPYVYAHSVRGVQRLGQRARQIAALLPPGEAMTLNVIAPDPHDHWPMPWYFRRIQPQRVSHYYDVPARPDAAMIVFTPDVWDKLQPRLRRGYQWEHYGLRPAVVLVAGVRLDLWNEFIQQLKARQGTPGAPSSRPGEEETVHSFTHRSMGSVFEVRIVGGDVERAHNAAEEAFQELDRLEKQLSRFNPYGDVGRINASQPGQPVRVDLETIECLSLARQAWAETGGAFDVTAGRPPEGGEAATIGMSLLAVDTEDNTIARKDGRLKIDLGGIAKGYGLERMAGVLREWDVRSALLNGGTSTVLAMGVGPADGGWRVALRDPNDEEGSVLGHVVLKDCAFSGSSTVHKRHITDPRTGRAVATGRATWVRAASATLADALSTAFCVMSNEEVDRYCRSHGGTSGIVAVADKGGWKLLEYGPAVVERPERK